MDLFSVTPSVAVYPGETIVIVGLEFGFSASQVVLSPTDNVADAGASILTSFVNWTDDRIEVLLPGSVPYMDAFLFVRDINGFANFDGWHLFNTPMIGSTGWWRGSITSVGWWRSSITSIGWWKAI